MEIRGAVEAVGPAVDAGGVAVMVLATGVAAVEFAPAGS
jgi:hypothetical protein